MNCQENQDHAKKSSMGLSDNLKAHEKKFIKTEANFEVKSGLNSDRMEPPNTENLYSYRNNSRTKEFEHGDQRMNGTNHQ